MGATIVSSAEAWKSDIVIKINPPSSAEAKLVEDRTLISQINPSKNEALLEQFQKQGSTVFALDCIPRMLSRGQTFDTLSSQTNIAGYRAVVEACVNAGVPVATVIGGGYDDDPAALARRHALVVRAAADVFSRHGLG